ncbi:esterase-like activity of phytase family protein [Marmoricola endophyticus]|uniref:esterase-like activity of phytase family protein n=1 Tax=Marmoricola endophyticus TaxID=2040280 RepID=UPI001E3FE79E|nr:esterase-like activity of phytase family protein [Marmoricola endophyticus]
MQKTSRAALGALALTLTTGALAGPALADDHGDGSVVRVYAPHVRPLATIGGTRVEGGAYGSSFVAKPGRSDRFYGLTDRGPNVDGPDGTKIEPLPDFQPAIGEFRLKDGKARLVRRIGLAAADGTPYNGRTNPANPTNETITDLDGTVLPPSPEGYDPEGLAAMPDGTFWVSDEYGPFITHVDRRGRAIARLSPTDGSLPRELAEREPNKGMEGLTVTPDGRTLVGIMQAGLNAPDGPKSKNLSALRIVTVDLRTRATKEYVYTLHTDGDPTTGVSEISALDDHRFLVDERDGKAEPGANKLLYEIDLRGATDIGPHSPVPGSSYDPARGGLLVGGENVEDIAGHSDTADTVANLADAGITPVSSSVFLDVAGLVSSIDPRGYFFGHDKIEGVAVLDRGKRLLISNDNDFGIAGVREQQPPYTLEPKLLPNGRQDDGELLEVRTGR